MVNLFIMLLPRRGMAVHPELVLGYTPIIIIITYQVLNNLACGTPVTEETIKEKIADLLEGNEEKIPPILEYFKEYGEKRELSSMDEQIIQQVKVISHKIVEKEFPEEEEYFDFLFDLTIQEIKELEPGKEAEFLREMR